jgi:magnesium chelatase family protein
MLATVYSRTSFGMEAPEVTIDVHLSAGLPYWSMVGLPEVAVKESRDRVRSAVINCGFEWPPGRITVNLAPADLPKEGGRFDLPIALCLLAADGRLPFSRLGRYEFYGELALGGNLRGVRGVLPAVVRAARELRPVMLPRANASEAQVVAGAHVVAAANLTEVIAHLRGERPLPCVERKCTACAEIEYPDLADVRGQWQACRALEIAAAGGHSVLLVGPPGAGKSLLAHRLPGILPALSSDEALETAVVASASFGGFRPETWGLRPFRAPHHTSSAIALVGGGSPPAPGEISLAHHGVLFLDELAEFDREALEALREPLEEGRVVISRAARQAQFPARFQLIAAMNPCPCGYFGDVSGRCRCGHRRIERYHARVSGPLMDRMDLHVRIAPVDLAASEPSTARGEGSAVVVRRVALAREVQRERQGVLNAELDIAGIDRWCPLSAGGRETLRRESQRLMLSGRAYHRVLRVARTIADLRAVECISAAHVHEAAAFRAMDCLTVAAVGQRGTAGAREGVAQVTASRFDEAHGSRSPQ